MKQTGQKDSQDILPGIHGDSETTADDSSMSPVDIFADLEATLDEVAESNPRIDDTESTNLKLNHDLRALLETTLTINSSLVLNDVLEVVMHKAIELMQAERGLIMLLGENDQLQTRSAYNLCKEEMMEEDFRISNSVTSEVARTAKPVYTSDAMADDRYAQHQSVMELHLRSIMCVPLIIKEKVYGVIYLDNSSQSKMFLKSDLYLFEMYAQLVSNALHNAGVYDSLLRMEKYNESVVDSSPVGIITIDARGGIITINPAALEIFDLDKPSIHVWKSCDQPTRFLDCLPESEQARWRAMMNTALATRQEYSDARFHHNTGYLEKVLSVKLCPLAGLPDGTEGLVMNVEDVTEKMTMEQYVILSEKLVAKGEMAASVAHELNNYLSIISNNAELLALNIDRNKLDKVKFNSKSITENVVKIKRFVDNLMSFSQPETVYISYDLKTVIDDVLFSLRIQPRFKLIHFTNDIAEDLPNAEIDVGQIQQVLMNLFINAGDTIDEHSIRMQNSQKEYKGEISVTAFFDQETEIATIEISDNGSGMSEDTLRKIFALHFTTKKGGHGLGLHNCQKIIENHGGEITARSQEDKGTTFSIRLPRVRHGERNNSE